MNDFSELFGINKDIGLSHFASLEYILDKVELLSIFTSHNVLTDMIELVHADFGCDMNFDSGSYKL